MLMMNIKLNDQKIIVNGEKTIKYAYGVINYGFQKFNLEKVETEDGSICYRDIGTNKDLGALFAVVFYFLKRPWFVNCVEDIRFYSDEDTYDGTIEVEDILEQFRTKGL